MRFIFCVVVLTLVATPTFGANQDEEILRRFAGVTRTDRQTAIYIYNGIDAFMRELGDQLSYIAESTDPLEEKDEAAREIIRDYFASRNSWVYVSVAPANKISRHPVKVYLHNLARIRAREGYTKVQLYFRPDYLGMGSIFSVYGSPGEYEISVSIIQVFIAQHPEFTYADETKKRLRIRFRLEGRTAKFKVHEILVLQTQPRREMTLER